MSEGKTPTARGSDARATRTEGEAASRLIDERIQALGDWRGATLAEARRLIHKADPGITEEWKWKGTPVWSRAGNICTGEVYQQVVKLTFARGASLDDPHGQFNASLDGKMRRAIDLRQGETLDADAFQTLIRAAVTENLRIQGTKTKSQSAGKTARPKPTPKTESEPRPVVLLAGGNPQIPKGDGDAPVQAYIAAMPGWKRDLGQRLDALIEQNVPGVRKAVRWNSPFYGVEGQGWFLSFHVLTRYVKVTFFNGLALRPIPPGGTAKSKDARWLDIHENEPLDETQMAIWIQQAAAIPGWTP